LDQLFARVTQFDIDTLVVSMDAAIAQFADQVLPTLRSQHGFQGVVVLKNEEGRGVLVSFWADKASADASIESGFYDEQARKFLTVYRQPPGRAHYEVSIMEGSAGAAVANGSRVP
jgi:heme-degrading monooxygenase HmoA